MINRLRPAPVCFLALAWLAVNLNAAAVKTWYFEDSPDATGEFDLKVPVSPATVSSWTICDTKSFSVSPTDKDYWTEPGGTPCNPTLLTGTGMNSTFSYAWGGTTAYVELVGSQTAPSTSYRAIACGATIIGALSVDLDPNNGSDDRQDFELFGGNHNVSSDPAEVTIVKLGPDFTGHVTPTNSTRDSGISIPTDCGGDLGRTVREFNSLTDYDFDPKTKADCRWYPQVSRIEIRSNSRVCDQNHTWVNTPANYTEWCKFNCINSEYPKYFTYSGNQDVDCTRIHEDYHENEQTADAVASISLTSYFNFSVPIVCDTVDTPAKAKLILQHAADVAAANWAQAVLGLIAMDPECPAYDAEASCHGALTHTVPSPTGTCNQDCETYGLTKTNC